MNRLFGLLVAVAILFSASPGYGGVGGIPSGDLRDDLCVPDFPLPDKQESDPRSPKDNETRQALQDLVKAKYYSYQVPILFRNEQTGEDYWTYARGCIPFTVNEKTGEQSRIGLGYSNVTINEPGQAAVNVSRLPGGDSPTLFIPYALTPERAPRVEVVSVNQSQVAVGVNADQLISGLPEPPEGEQAENVTLQMSTVEMLQLAGFFRVRSKPTPNNQEPPDAFWVEYSDSFTLRQVWPSVHLPHRAQFSKGWLNARFLMCDPSSKTLRPENNLEFARNFMVKDPAFTYNLAPASQVKCDPLQDTTADGTKWQWGGGVGVFYLFPNIILNAQHSIVVDGQGPTKVRVTGNLVNQSAGQGPVYLYYRWGYGERWQVKVTPEVRPYQGHTQPAGEPFSFEVDVPPGGKELQIFAAPGAETGLALIDPNPEPKDKQNQSIKRAVKLWETEADPDLLKDERPVVTHLWNYTEFKVSDNFYKVDLTCGDLRVELSAAEEGSPAGFEITATAIRDGCPDLTSVPVDINIDGQKQRGTAYFNGKTATVSFFSGPKEPGVVSIRGWVDPLNAVPETNETNNGDTIAVVVSQPTGWPTWTTPGTGPVTDPDSLQCPDDIPQEKCFSTRITK